MTAGFGEIEKAEVQIIEECYAAITHGGKPIREALSEIEQKYLDAKEKYSKMDQQESPARYSYFSYLLIEEYVGSGMYIVEFRFSHVNRRHPMSPDGWALIITDASLHVCPVFGARINRGYMIIESGAEIQERERQETEAGQG